MKIRDYCYHIGEYSGVAHSICNLEYSVPKNIPMVFHNGWNYDYNFIIKKLAEELKKQFTFLGKNTEKYITFAIPIEKEATRIDKNGEKITKNKFYILQFIDSARFMASSLSSLVDNLSEGIHKIKCKRRQNYDKNCKTCGSKYNYCDYFLEYRNLKDNLIKYKCLICNKNCQTKFDEKLKEQSFNTCKCYNHDNNKFILLLQKRVCKYVEIKKYRWISWFACSRWYVIVSWCIWEL